MTLTIPVVPVVYVAGPYRANNAWQREKNIREAEELGFRVAELGGIPLIPHTMFRYFDGTLPDEFWLDGTLAHLARCDASVFSVRWEQSSGSRRERAFCVEHGIKIFEEHHLTLAFTHWIKNWQTVKFLTAEVREQG